MVDAVEPLKARRIYLLLRERILNGALEPGSRLPGELSIAAEYGVSRVTVRRALDNLAIDGLIDPLAVMRGLWERARERGARLWTDTRVTGIELDGGAVVRLDTSRGRISTRAVVNAAGAWAAVRDADPDQGQYRDPGAAADDGGQPCLGAERDQPRRSARRAAP